MEYPKDYACEGQISIFDILPAKYGDKNCGVCGWNRDGRCQWAIFKDKPGKPIINYSYPECGGYCSFMPSEYMVPRMCANCEYGNQFHYETKPEYEKSLERHNGYTLEAANDPLEEPDIYCTHKEGSLNRRTEYKECEQAGFGIGHWHRQHEWDTCDRWKLSTGPYMNYSELRRSITDDIGDDGRTRR